MFNNIYNDKLNNPQFSAVSPQQGNQPQVPMQAVNPELLKQNVQDTYVANRVSETTDDPKGMLYTAGIGIPAWFAISKGMDIYANKSRGNYENTIHYKVGQFGDDVTSYVKNSSFGKSNFATITNNGFKGIKHFFKQHIIDRFKITRAMTYTSSLPELDMVKGQANGMWGMILYDYPQHIEKFVEPLKYIEDLDCYGASDKDISKWKNLLDNAPTSQAKAEILQKAEFETILQNSRVKRTDSYIKSAIADFEKLPFADRASKLKDMKAFEWGYKDFAELEVVKKNIQDRMPRVLEACHDANKNMFARIWGSNSTSLRKLKTKIIGREVYASETANKIAASLGNVNLKNHPELEQVLNKTGLINKIPKSILGKILAKYNNLILEGATNRVAGGKFVAIAQAFYLADVIYKSAKAEGGGSEKFKSFMERFTEMIAFFACMPLAIQLMHKIGGLQYAGMGKTPEEMKKAVEAYRKHLNEHNMKAMAGKFANKAEWKASKKALRKELNAGVKNPITKLFKQIGRIVSVGLEQIRPYDNKAVTRNSIMDKIKDLFRHPKFGMKQMAGYPVRIILGMMMILPFLSKIAVKGSHLLFGKPKNSILDEGKEDKNVANNQTNLNQTQVPPQLQQTQNYSQNTSSTNLLDKYKNGAQSAQVLQTTPQNTQNTIKPETTQYKPATNEPVRTYIPSPEGVKLQNEGQEDMTQANAVMHKADLAEQEALKTLKMN